jgi:hypothetical protein
MSGVTGSRHYRFVRLHQSSTFYGVASKLLGGGRLQQHEPEAGLHGRADQLTISAYYDDLLADSLQGSSRVFSRLRMGGGLPLCLARLAPTLY